MSWVCVICGEERRVEGRKVVESWVGMPFSIPFFFRLVCMGKGGGSSRGWEGSLFMCYVGLSSKMGLWDRGK